MPRLLLALCALLLLAAEPAAAKPGELEVCGPSACKELGPGAPAAGLFAGATAAPGMPGPYYEIRGYSHGTAAGRWAYVPGAPAIWRSPGSWIRLTPQQDAQWRRFVAGLRPYGGPTVRRATVGGRVVQDPASYLAIFSAPATLASFGGTPRPIVLESDRATPWTGTNPIGDFYAREGVVVAAGAILRLPSVIAEQVRHGNSLRPPV